jgi:signal transduction histidine kinase
MEVVLNVLKNARDAMGGSGTIFISTGTVEENGNRYAMAEFRDTGAGIPDDLTDKIFDPFFTTKEKGGGHNIGLGLSLSLSIIKEHGGRIEAANSPEGGALFRIYLPVHMEGLKTHVK